MIVHVTDTHDSHGSVFTLNFWVEFGNEQDQDVIQFLENQFRTERMGNGRFAFYVREIKRIDGRLSVTLSDNPIHMAKVDHHWNQTRKDLKFPVLMLDQRDEEYKHDVVPHFSCHWCKEDVYGVQREAIEVYDPETDGMELVQVHSECQKIREKQIAEIPFADSL